MLSRKYLVIGLILIVMVSSNLVVIGFCRNETTIKPYAYLEVVIGGNITNAGEELVYINETDLLVFDYPFNTSSQEVLSTEVYFENSLIDYYIDTDDEGNYRVVGNISGFERDYIGVNETVSATAVYRVFVNMSTRSSEIAGLSLENAGNWSDVFVEEDVLVEETGLWNYSNPLVKLLSKYIRSRHNTSPLDYLLGVLDWVDDNVEYVVRVPARHPWEVIAYREGDCDDQSNLVITLLRGAGIPSYLEIGLVYLDRSLKYLNKPGYNTTIEAANGYLTYHFIGGGAHGWMVAYIPPWGYIRIDLTFARGGLNHIRSAAYYGLNGFVPTVVLTKVKKRDYVESSTKFIEEVQEKKLIYNIVVYMRETD